MNITRRIFLKNGGLALASIGLAPVIGPAFLQRSVFAAEPDASRRKKTLICIFQRGAMDGLSAVTPYGDAELYKLRPNLAVAAPTSGNKGESALDLDGFFGLHPSLSAFLPLYQSGHLAVIHACGSPNTTRSHFDAQDYMESGIPTSKSVADGWLARTIAQCPEDRKNTANPFRAVALGGPLPRSLQGDSNALALPDLKTFGVGGGIARLAGGNGDVAGGFETLYNDAVGDVLHGTGKESFEAIKMLKKLNPTAYRSAPGANYPTGKFAESLKQIAQLIKADVGVEVAFADVGGWDTHANQGGAQGQLANRLREFSNAIAALHHDLGDRMNDVVILTMSEFGRTARQNGTGGTDHGHATCFFALGGAVNGGVVLSKWPGLAPEQLNDNRDLALTTDYRAVFAEVAQKHLKATHIEKIFPDYRVSQSDYPGVLRSI